MSNAFSKTLSVVSVIEYHDGPLLFTAEDPIGTRYICAFLETKPTGTEYLCVPLSPARFNSFLNGARDLRSLFEEPEIAEFYKIVTLADDAQWLIATPLEMGSVQRDLFPAAGYFVPPSEWHPKEVERNHSLVEASIEVQEALNHPLIETDTLSEFLTGIQDALRFACRRAISERPKEDRQGRSYQLLSRTE